MDNLEITGINHTGEGIGRIDGKVIFVPKTVPGDVVRIKDVVDCKSYCRGCIDEVIKPSSDRVEIDCLYYDKCGGCQLMGISYFKQLEYKRDKVRNILKRYGDIDIDLDIILIRKVYGYRNKITLQVVDGEIGLYSYNSKDFVKVDSCMLVSNKVNRIIGVIRDNLDLSLIRQIMIREYEGDLLIKFIGDIEENVLINVLGDEVTCIYVNDCLIYGDENIEVKLGECRYKVSPDSFFQVNYDGALILYDKIKEYLGEGNRKVLDLYCGTGTIGIYVSLNCEEVVGIEINESSVRDAMDNIRLNEVDNVRVVLGDVSKVLDGGEDYQAIIVDPPRSGLDKKTKNILLSMKSEKIIYVSCDPITLARDLKVLGSEYEIKDMVLVDMFPNTYHVESVVLLCLKK